MKISKLSVILITFSIAMGFLEAAVVIYLRLIYYPSGFAFPLVVIPPDVGAVELLREAATIIMMLAVSWISAKSFLQRLYVFILCFGVWDLVYYIVLKLFFDWPQSVFEWDILFLIPLPWLGPVLAPCIVSITMIFMALAFIDGKTIFTVKDYLLLLAGCFMILFTFFQPFIAQLELSETLNITGINSTGVFYNLQTFIPVNYNWPLFIAGETVIVFTLLLKLRDRYRKSRYPVQ